MRVIKREQPSSRTGIFRHAIRVGFATGTLIALSACLSGLEALAHASHTGPPANFREWLQRSFGPAWALAGVVVGGLADAHSTAASVGSLTSSEQMQRSLGAVAVGLVVTTNTVSKLVFARAGGAGYFWRLAPGLVLLVASFWVTWWLARGVERAAT